jgi:hypothetical protein
MAKNTMWDRLTKIKNLRKTFENQRNGKRGPERIKLLSFCIQYRSGAMLDIRRLNYLRIHSVPPCEVATP